MLLVGKFFSGSGWNLTGVNIGLSGVIFKEPINECGLQSFHRRCYFGNEVNTQKRLVVLGHQEGGVSQTWFAHRAAWGRTSPWSSRRREQH